MSFWEQNQDLIGATITIAITFALAFAVDRLVLGRAARFASPLADVSVSRAAVTRLRVVRRLVFVVILLVGVSLALNQFTNLEKLTTGLLASSAVLAIVLGLAARQVLANPLAGVMLAITQPIRIGDEITIDEETGRVDDLTLSYTFVNTKDGRLMIIPNEQVVSTVVFNRSTGDQTAPATASVWLPPGADVQAARSALAPLEATGIELAEITADGLRLVVKGPEGTARTLVPGEEAALRERAHQLLRGAGLVGGGHEPEG
ncbi:MAG: mechanosensitive ion channel family protein [Actinomycetota bacterium]|nr:mechanosensitive ion channel family protein [Actinomycetota bacterium]